jgi:hypothetical protein
MLVSKPSKPRRVRIGQDVRYSKVKSQFALFLFSFLQARHGGQ